MQTPPELPSVTRLRGRGFKLARRKRQNTSYQTEKIMKTREQKAKLTLSGQPRKKPGPKPRLRVLHGATTGSDPLTVCISAADAAPDTTSAADAYRRAMPAMSSISLGTWATLVAQGVARRAFTGKEGSTMLWAAQVASHGGK